MNDLELELGSLKLRLRCLRRHVEQPEQPYSDWLECDLRVNAPAFEGSVRWSVMPRELSALAVDLDALYAAFPQRGSVTFRPTEPNLTLSWEIEALGGVVGVCETTDDLVVGDTLSVHFSIDQSQLPGIARAVRAFVQAAAPK